MQGVSLARAQLEHRCPLYSSSLLVSDIFQCQPQTLPVRPHIRLWATSACTQKPCSLSSTGPSPHSPWS